VIVSSLSVLLVLVLSVMNQGVVLKDAEKQMLKHNSMPYYTQQGYL
jgi:hypothetical protein